MQSNRMTRPKRRLGATHTQHSLSSINRYARWLGPELWRALVAIVCCGLLLQQLPWLARVGAQQNQQTISLEGEQLPDTKVRLSWRISNPGAIIAVRILRSETSPLSGFEVIGTTAASATDFIDSNVNLNITYYYQVRTASPTNIASRPSNVFTIKLQPAASATPTPTISPRPTTTPTPDPAPTPSSTPVPAPGSLPGIYVAPNGSASGDGSATRPLDLAKALSSRSPARPGDTIWLRGGTYFGAYESVLNGTASAPIQVRAYPGERATLDGKASAEATLTVKGSWTNYQGFEITNTNPDRVQTRPAGLSIYGPNTKFINLIIHDTGGGIGAWTPALDAEIYGCVIFNNGWQGPAPDRGHGHGIYIQNETGTKKVIDNLVFNQFGYGIHAYTEQGSIKGFYFEGNTVFGSGTLARAPENFFPNFLIGGYPSAERITLVSNYLYHPLDAPAHNASFYYQNENNRDLTLRNNYVAGGSLGAWIKSWQKVSGSGNTFIGQSYLIWIAPANGANLSNFTWNNNSYVQLNSDPNFSAFNDSGTGQTFNNWRQVTGYDRDSQYTRRANQRPGGTVSFVRPNAYEAGRAHITVFNWDLLNTVEIAESQLTNLLRPGSAFEVRDAENFFGPPVLRDTYKGGPLRLPMINGGAATEFKAFVLLPLTGSAPLPTPSPTPRSSPTPTPRPSPTPTPTPVPAPSPTPTPTPLPTPTPTPDGTVDPAAVPLDAEEQALFDLLDDYRRTMKLGPLGLAISLTNAATWAAKDMAGHNYISKIDSLGRSPSQRARAFGHPGERGAVPEDALVLAGDLGGVAIFELWRSSQLNAVLTNPSWKVVGIGRAFNANTKRWHWQVLFGSFWDKTQLLAGEDEEGRIDGNPLIRTRPPSEALAGQHYITGYGDDDAPYSPMHCDLSIEPQTCWHDPPPQINLRLLEPTALENLFGTWEVFYQIAERGVVHANYDDYDRTSIVMELRINENGSWASRGYRAYMTPTPLESGTWQAVLDSARNEILLTLTRANRLPRATIRVHASQDQLTFFAVDGGALMKNFFRGWPGDENVTDDPQIIFGRTAP